MTAPIQDLRDAIALLQQHDNQYLETDHPVDLTPSWPVFIAISARAAP